MLFSLSSCSEKKVSSERYCFGTLCTVTIYGKCGNSDEIFNGLWNEMADLENRISAKLAYSTVSKMNNKEETEPDKDISKLIEIGERFEELTGGRFSIYIGAVTELWNIGTESARVPEKDEIEGALKKRSIDLGALGKGYASDIAREYLKKCGVKSAIINFGGNICCLGSKGKKDFVIGIQNPDGQRGTYSKTVEVSDMCVVTSGSYERYFEQDGVRYCHIFNALTGYPVKPEKNGVTIVGPEGVICDALSTCCFILGEKEAMNLLEQFEDYSVLFL